MYALGKTIVIASVYLDGNEMVNVIPNWLSSVVIYAEEKGFDVVIGMDSNAHSE